MRQSTRRRTLRSVGAKGLALFASASAITWGAVTLGFDAVGRAKADDFVNSSETINYVSREFDPEVVNEETVSEEVTSEEVVEEEIEVSVDADGNLWDQNGNRIDEEGHILDADGNIVENATENVIEAEEFREMETPELTQTHLYVRTKYTFVDGTVPLGDGRTVYDLGSIDEFFANDAASSAYNGSLEGMATLYDGASENYYVMLVNSMYQNGMKGKTIGVDFAQNNDEAEMVEGAIYDAETGLAYIPKSITPSDQAIDDGMFLQAQVMVAIDGYQLPETTLQVDSISTRPDIRAVGQTAVRGGDWVDVIEVPVVDPEDAGKVTLSDLSAYVDGMSDPLTLEDGETAMYDQTTGILSLAADAQALSGLKVVIGGTLLDSLVPVANAAPTLTPASMNKYPYGELTEEAAQALAKKEGKIISYTGWVLHNYYPYSGYDGEYSVGGGRKWKYNNRLYYANGNVDRRYGIDNSLDPTKFTWKELSQEGANYSSTHVTKQLTPAYGYWFTIEVPSSTTLKGITGPNGVKKMSLSFNSTKKKTQVVVPATCNHIRTSAGHNTMLYQSTIDMKVLKADMTSSSRSIVIAFHAKKGTGTSDPFGPAHQEATAVYAFKVEKSTPGRIAVQKINKSTKKIVKKAGFKFVLRKDGSTTNLATVTTDNTGTAEFNKDLPAGKYRVIETASPAGFTKPSNAVGKAITVKADGSGGKKRGNQYVYTVSYSDYPCAYLNIVKKDSNGTTIPLAGFTFQVTGKTVAGDVASDFSKTVTTDAKGVASCSVPILVPSTVSIKETKAVAPFIADPGPRTLKFAATDDVGSAQFTYNSATKACSARSGVKDLATINWPNKQHAHIEVTKLNSITKKPVTIKNGFQFALYQGNNEIERAWTDDDGIARFSTSCSVPGTYTVKEVAVANTVPFYLSSVVHTVKLTATGSKGAVSGGIVDSKIHSSDSNCASTANVVKVSDTVMANTPWCMAKVQKLSNQRKSEGVDAAAVKMAGFKFRITGTDWEGNKIDETATTDANGVAKFKAKLVVGNTYTLEETEAVSPFTRSLKKVTIKPAADGNLGDVVGGVTDKEMSGVNAKNVLFVRDWNLADDQYAFIEVQKINKATGKPVRKAKFSFSLSGPDLNGRAFKDTVETDSDGIARFKRKIRVGSEYTIQEASVIEPFTLNTTVAKVTPQAGETDGSVAGGIVDAKIGDSATAGVANVLLVNDEKLANKQYGYIRIIKRNAETGKTIPLANVVFDIYDGETKLATAKTGADGMVIAPQTNGKPYRFAVPGTYTIKEVSVPMPYTLKKDPITVTLEPNGDLGALKNGHSQAGVSDIDCVVDAIVSNAPQYGRATVVKQDSEDGTRLRGASYKVIAMRDVSYIGQGDETRDASKSCGYPTVKTTEIKSGSSSFDRTTGEVTVTNPIVFVDKDGTEFDTITTDASGEAVTGWLPIDDSGLSEYALIEVDNAEGRLIDGTPLTFSLAYNGQVEAAGPTASLTQSDDGNITIVRKVTGDGSALAGATIGLWKRSDDVRYILSSATGAPKDTDTYVLRTPDNTIVPKAHRRIRGVAVDGTGVVSEERSLRIEQDGDGKVLTLNMESAIATDLAPGSYVATLVGKDGNPIGGSNSVKFEAKEAEQVTVAFESDDGSSLSIKTVVAPTEGRSATFQWRSDISAWVATDLLPASTYQVEIGRKVVKTIDTSVNGGEYWFGRYADQAGGMFHASYLDQASFPKNDSLMIPSSSIDGKEYPYAKVTNENGTIEFSRLPTGSYVIAEILPPIDATGHRSYLVDARCHVIDVDGTTGYVTLLDTDNRRPQNANSNRITMRNLEIGFTDDITKVDISKRDVTGGDEIEGAELLLTDANTNEEIDRWTSTREPHRIVGLIPGRYRLTEYMTPKDYDRAESIEFTVLPSGVPQKHIMLDAPVSIDAEIDKRQEIANPLDERDDPNDEENHAKAQANLVGDYDYSLDFRSNSNTWTDEFTVEDPLEPANDGLAHLMSITTPQAWQDYDGKMNVWYRTNKTPLDYRDLATEDTETKQGEDEKKEGETEEKDGDSQGDQADGNGQPDEGNQQQGDNGQSGQSEADDQQDGNDAGDASGQENGGDAGDQQQGDQQQGDDAAESKSGEPRPWTRFAANATLSDGHENAWLYDDKAMSGDIDGDCRIIDYVGWKLWKADLSTTVSTTLEVKDLGLAEDEYVTGIRFEYGRVEVGFTTRTDQWERELLKDLHDDLDSIDASNRGTFADHDDAIRAAVTRLSTELARFQTEVSKAQEEEIKKADVADAEAKEALRKEIDEYNEALAKMEETQGLLWKFLETPLVPAYDGDPETDASLASLNEATEATKLAIRAAMTMPGVEDGSKQEAREAILKAAEELYDDVNGTIDAAASARLRSAIDAYADEMARIPEDGGAHDMDEATAVLTDALVATIDAMRSVALAGRVPYAPAVVAMRLTDKYITGTELRNSAEVDAYRNGGNDDSEDLRTTLTNAEDGSHVVSPTGTVTVRDRVAYRNLVPGTKYVMKGTLHLRKDGADAGPIEQDGKTVSASQEFVPKSPAGSVELEFSFDASLIDGGAAVAFERCEVAADGTVVGTHEDINDEGQSVTPETPTDQPTIRTSLVDKESGSHEIAESGKVTVVDTVTYRNLVPDKRYAMTGTLHIRRDGADAGVLLSDGKPVTVTEEFVPKQADGTVKLEFTFDVSDLGGGAAVAFESCRELTDDESPDAPGASDRQPVATHEDINDAGQTVEPVSEEKPVNKLEGHDRDEVMQRPKKHTYEIGTYLATVDGQKHIDIDGSQPVVLVDHVAYSGLIPGNEYEMAAELHINLNHTDGGIIQGSKTTQRFTANASDGTVEVRITVPKGEMPLAPWVAFEELHKVIPETGQSSEYVLASHMDINDSDQTVDTSEIADDLIQLGGMLKSIAVASVVATTCLGVAFAVSRRKRSA